MWITAAQALTAPDQTAAHDLFVRAYLLNGDNLRHGLSDDLGFSPGRSGRKHQGVGHLTRLLADAAVVRCGVAGVAAAVGPRDRPRAQRRRKAAVGGGVRRDVAVREKRDFKGLYARARKGEMKRLTGVDARCEPPENPDLSWTPRARTSTTSSRR
jgi:bifunctional enzyme CysN/CysC